MYSLVQQYKEKGKPDNNRAKACLWYGRQYDLRKGFYDWTKVTGDIGKGRQFLK